MANNVLNLKELEQMAYRRTYQDGLLDIYMGGLLASFAAFGFTIFPGGDTESLTVLLYYLLGMGLSGLIFWLGKRYITLPRIGLVTFGPARQKRRSDLIIALAIIAAVQLAAVLLQISMLNNPALLSSVRPFFSTGSQANLAIAIAAALFVSPGMLLIAYKMDNPRGYYHAVVMTTAIFLMILLDQAWWMVLGGVLIILPGIYQLVWFLKQYPLESIPHDHQ